MKDLILNWLPIIPVWLLIDRLLMKIKPIPTEKRRKIWLSIPAFFVFDYLRYFSTTYFPRLSNWWLASLACLIAYGIIRLMLLPFLLLPADKKEKYLKILTVLLIIIWLGLSWLVLT